MSQVMTAAVLTRFGGSAVLELHHDCPVLAPLVRGPQVVVRVSAVNNTDIWTRQGARHGVVAAAGGVGDDGLDGDEREVALPELDRRSAVLVLDVPAGRSTRPSLSPRTAIKAGSQLGLTGTRAGSYRTLSVATAYYSPAVSAYRMWGGEKVQLQYKACATCTWTYLRNVYTASNGRATYRTYSAHLRYYRAVSAANSSIWGRTSAAILR